MSKYKEVFEKWFEENSKNFVGKSTKGIMKEAFGLGVRTRKQMEHGISYGFSGPQFATLDSVMSGLYAAKEEAEKPNPKFFYMDTECGSISDDKIRKIADKIRNDGFSEGGVIPKSQHPFKFIDYPSMHPFRFTKSDEEEIGKAFEKLRESLGYKKKEETPKPDTQRFRYEYIKRENKVVGIMLAWIPRDMKAFGVGYSICDPRDEFSWETAIRLAFDRMFFDPYLPEVPNHIKDQFHTFVYETRHKFKLPYVSIPNRNKNYDSFLACVPQFFKDKMKESPIKPVTKPTIERYFRSYSMHSDSIGFSDEVSKDAPGKKIKIEMEIVDN